MKRDDLKTLGLNDEMISGVLGIHHAEVEALKEAHATEVKEVKSQIGNYENQLTELGNKLGEAQKGASGMDELQRSLAVVKGDLETAQKQNAALQKQQAIRAGLSTYKLHDADTVMRLLDHDAINIGKNGDLVGLKEQMEPLKASKAFLFADAPDPNGGFGEPDRNPIAPSGSSRNRTGRIGLQRPRMP